MNIVHFCLIFINLSLCSKAIPIIDDVQTFYKWFHFTAEMVENSMHLYDEFKHTNDFLRLSVQEKLLHDNLRNLTLFINRIETNVPQVTIARINKLEHDFSEIIRFEIKLDSLVKHIDRIENSYRTFLSLQKKLKDKVNNSTEDKAIALKWTMEDFAKSVITMQGDSIRNSLSAVHDMIDLHDGSSFYAKNDIFTLILNNFNEKTPSRCLIDKSPQQLIFDTLTSLKLTQLKGMMMIEYAYIILRLYMGGNFKTDMEDFQAEMLNRFDKQAKVALNVIKQADNSYWKCDPNKHIADQTYTEITRLVQGHIHNEKELSPKDTCFEGCGFYSYEKSPKCRNSDKLCRSQPNCQGRVFDCKFVNEDMNICFSPFGTSRKYEWIRFSGGPNFGHTEQSCQTGSSYIEKFRKLLIWRCLYCFCLCDDETNSDRYFSLQEITSDIENNQVVVGVRFVKKKRVIHLQIKQAKLLSVGMVDNTSISWIDLPEINIGNWKDQSKFHKLSYESRSLDLDDIMAPSGFLVTGVRMRMVGSHLNLEVRFTAFNFNSGKLFQNLTMWKGNDNTDASQSPRTEHSLARNKRLPIEASNDRHSPDSESNTFIQFQPSDEYTDAAQSTVPFIDTQIVTTNPPLPMVGLGIIHKGALASSGFIEPKIFTLNVAELSLVKVEPAIVAVNEEVTTTSK